MRKSEVEKRRRWQNSVYDTLKSFKKEEIVDFLGREVVVKPGVFAPLWMDSKLLGRAVEEEVKIDDYVLDLGTGSGAQGRITAEKAERVLCADINPKAVKCAKETMQVGGRLGNTDFVQSDIFSNIHGRYDLIIYNPPFRWFSPRDMLERAATDKHYYSLARFFSEFRVHLTEKGRALAVFSNSGDLQRFNELIESNQVNSEVIAKANSDGWRYLVYRFTK